MRLSALAGLLIAGAAPGNVTDLSVVASSGTVATLTWTEVNSGAATAASYDVRYAAVPPTLFQWWTVHLTPPIVVVGTTPAGGVKLSRTINGLTPGVQYSFEITAFTGTLNVDAVFSPSVSNVVSMTMPVIPPPPPTTGALVVSVATSGSSLDPDGYVAAVDGGAGQALAVSGSTAFANLLVGGHTVVLSGVASNCTVSAGNSRTVQVVAGSTVTAAFSVACVTPTVLAKSLTGPSLVSLDSGTSVPLFMTVKDSAGNGLTTRQVHFVSSNPAIATVDSTGPTSAMVRGLRVGWDTVRASVDGIAWPTVVTVLRPTVVPPVAFPLFITNLHFNGMALPIFPGSWSFTASDSAGRTAVVTITITTSSPAARRRVRSRRP